MPSEGLPTGDGVIPVIHRAPHPLVHGGDMPWGFGTALRDHTNPAHMAEDLTLLQSGVLDQASFISGYIPHKDPVRIEIRDKHGNLKALRHSHNLRTNAGTAWQSILMGGDTGMAGDTGTGGTVTYTSTGVADSGKAWTSSQWVNHMVCSGAVWGSITASTATGLTVDRWYAPATPGGSAGTTPSAAATYTILPGGVPAAYIALTNDSGQSINTVQTSLTSEISTNGLARALAAFTPTNPSSSSGTTNQGTYTLVKTFTATGTQACQRAAVFTASSSGTMAFFASFTGATLASGDTMTVTWTVND